MLDNLRLAQPAVKQAKRPLALLHQAGLLVVAGKVLNPAGRCGAGLQVCPPVPTQPPQSLGRGGPRRVCLHMCRMCVQPYTCAGFEG